MAGPNASALPHEVGLCRECAYGQLKESGRGSSFWRCARAERDPGFPRYPRLPVRSCPGHEPIRGADAGPDA